MRIGLDCRTITAPKTGDRTYALNLAAALARLDTGNEYCFYTWEPATAEDLGHSGIMPTLLPASPRWTWTPFAFPRDLKRRKADLAHVQYIMPPVAPCPVITTIHDISFRRYPALFPLKHRILLNTLVPLSARRAAAVITGSEATKRDLVEFYGLSPDRVFVTPYGVDSAYRPIGRAEALHGLAGRYSLPEPYLLCVGVLHPRKNLARLVRAYNRIALDIPHRLVIVGKEGWASKDLQQAAAACPPDRAPVFTGYVPDADLPLLYSAADAFLYPSLYEGFGLPPLEAMACGTPVIASSASCIPEVVGDAGILVDPTSEEAIATAIRKVALDPGLRRELAAAGLRQAAQFTWERTAQATLRVYEAVVKTQQGGRRR